MYADFLGDLWHTGRRWALCHRSRCESQLRVYHLSAVSVCRTGSGWRRWFSLDSMGLTLYRNCFTDRSLWMDFQLSFGSSGKQKGRVGARVSLRKHVARGSDNFLCRGRSWTPDFVFHASWELSSTVAFSWRNSWAFPQVCLRFQDRILFQAFLFHRFDFDFFALFYFI